MVATTKCNVQDNVSQERIEKRREIEIELIFKKTDDIIALVHLESKLT